MTAHPDETAREARKIATALLAVAGKVLAVVPTPQGHTPGTVIGPFDTSAVVLIREVVDLVNAYVPGVTARVEPHQTTPNQLVIGCSWRAT